MERWFHSIDVSSSHPRQIQNTSTAEGKVKVPSKNEDVESLSCMANGENQINFLHVCTPIEDMVELNSQTRLHTSISEVM